MNPETSKKIDAFLEDKEEICDSLFEQFEETLGVVPFILPILRERPDSFAFNGLGDLYTFNPESMDRVTAELIAVAAAAATGADGCLKVHIGAAMKEGATREQVRDAIAIAALIGKTGILGGAFRVMRTAIPDEK
jgi:4-carboxymuconolactone decarboxylase